MKHGYVYIMTNQRSGTLYIGFTSDAWRRAIEHKEGRIDGFTKKYGLKMLVHLETFPSIADAIAREKQLKRWHRDWKINLINEHNPDWKDLSVEWMDAEPNSA
jgi:putative endonuclease